jgi:hypothetical protein
MKRIIQKDSFHYAQFFNRGKTQNDKKWQNKEEKICQKLITDCVKNVTSEQKVKMFITDILHGM